MSMSLFRFTGMVDVVYNVVAAKLCSGYAVTWPFSELWSVAWPEALCVVMWMVGLYRGEGV